MVTQLVDHKQCNNKGKLGQKTQKTQQSTRDWLNSIGSELEAVKAVVVLPLVTL